MEIKSNNGFIESFLAQKLSAQQNPRVQTLVPSRNTQAPNNSQKNQSKDLILFSDNGMQARTFSYGRAKLISQTEEEIPNGVRLTQEFVNSDGRTFTKIQNLTVTDRGFSREVLQQNPSGSTTQLEETIKPQDNGFFERIQRYTNEIGETETKIDKNFVSNGPFTLNTNQYGIGSQSSYRGSQLDLSA